MPTYEYECKKCGPFEVFQSIKDEKLKRCPACKGVVKRLMGRGSGILFKGSGFYQTDYRSSGYKSDASAATKSSSETSATKTAGSDAGAAEKTKTEKK